MPDEHAAVAVEGAVHGEGEEEGGGGAGPPHRHPGHTRQQVGASMKRICPKMTGFLQGGAPHT